MTTKLIFSIISLGLVIGTPIIFYGYLRKARGIRPGFWNILVGIILEFICKDVLLGLIIAALSYIPAAANLLTNSLTYGIINIALTVILLTCGLLIVRKFYYHGNIQVNQACGIAIGATVADTLLSFLMAALSNLIYIYQISNGTLYENLLLSVSPEQASLVIESYNSLPLSYFLYVGIIAVASLCSNYLIAMIFARKKSNEAVHIITLVCIIAIVITVYYYTNPLTLSFANPSLVIFAGLFFGFADINCRYKLNEERRVNAHGQ